MKIPHRTEGFGYIDGLLVLYLIVIMGSFASIGSAQASEIVGNAQTSANAVTSEAPGLTGDYRLAPGDRLTILVYDEPQLSGEFIIDGGGAILVPLIGSVSLKGFTLAEAQQLIQRRFADGILVQPEINVGIKEYRPIFVTGSVRRPGSYPFMIGQSVKAAIAAAGGEGEPLDSSTGLVSEFITAEQRVRQLEADYPILVMRKARLEVQRDGRGSFIVPMPVGVNRNMNFDHAYSAENDTFSRLGEAYRRQVETLESQRPRLEAEINAVIDQIDKQKEHLVIVNNRLSDLEGLFSKRLLRKELLQNQQIEASMVEGQILNLEAQVARLRQSMGDLDVRLGELKANNLRQTLLELQDTEQRLREVTTSIGPARRLLHVRAEGIDSGVDDAEYSIRISRVRDGGIITLDATDESMLSPGDVVEVKRQRPAVLDLEGTQAIRELDPTSSVLSIRSPTPEKGAAVTKSVTK